MKDKKGFKNCRIWKKFIIYILAWKLFYRIQKKIMFDYEEWKELGHLCDKCKCSNEIKSLVFV